MRIFVTLLTILVGANCFAAKKSTGSSSESRPLNSVLYHVPHKKTEASGSLGILFGNRTQETLGTVLGTQTQEYQSTRFDNTYELNYGVLPNLSIGANIGYSSKTEKNTSYTDTAGTPNAPLAPTIKDSGITDPSLLLDYRLLDSDFVVDVSGLLRLGFIGAERGTAVDTNADGIQDTGTNGNAGSGSYGVSAGVRAGYAIMSDLNLIAGLRVNYNFDGQVTYKNPTADYVVDTDSYMSFAPRFEAEYFITPEFSLNPFLSIDFNPKTKSRYTQVGVTTELDIEAAKTFTVGLMGNYLISSDLALQGGYSYLSIESAKTQASTAGGPFIAFTNAKDLDAHRLLARLNYEF